MAGICLLVSNCKLIKLTLNIVFISILTAINTWAKIYKKWAERDGRIDSCEKICIRFNRFSGLAMIIVQLVMLIWGSVVVFGAWATWTDDFGKYSENTDEFNFCKYRPMVFAFRLLLLQWVSSMNGATKY